MSMVSTTKLNFTVYITTSSGISYNPLEISNRGSRINTSTYMHQPRYNHGLQVKTVKKQNRIIHVLSILIRENSL